MFSDMSSVTKLPYKVAFASFRRSIQDWRGVYTAALENLSGYGVDRKIGQAKTCLCIGPNTGECEIQFVKRFMPHLERLVAVEPLPSSALDLEVNLKRNLPNVEIVVHQMTCQQFMQESHDGRSSYDVVTLFHVLYYMEYEDRMALFEKCNDGLLSKDGSVVAHHAKRADEQDEFQVLIDQFRTPRTFTTMETFRGELLATGFSIYCEHEYAICYDMSEPDENLLTFVSENIVGRKLSSRDFQDAVQRVQPTGKFNETYVFMLLDA